MRTRRKRTSGSRGSTAPRRGAGRGARRRPPVDPVTAYAQAVVDGEVLAGKLVRLAAERHIRDLKRKDLVWDLAAAKRAIKFFPDVLRLNGGEWEGKPFHPQPWQAFIIGAIFGWKGLDSHRRFRTAYVEIAKGNGKSPLAAGIGHLMLTADGEPRAEVYAAATKKDQAMILFRDAVAMRDQSPHLRRRLKPSGQPPNVWNLGYVEKGAFFRPISSDEKSQSGPRPHCGLIDELHEHKTATVVDMMRAGTKGHRQALIFEITNSGWDRTTVCWHHHEYSAKILEGALDNDAWFAYVAGLDEGDDWTDESVWPKANPNLGVSVTLKYLREQVREAKGMPTKENIVRRLNFCQWTEQAEIWIPIESWKACEDPRLAAAEALRGRDCIGALDLSDTTDITALGLYFPPPDRRCESCGKPGGDVESHCETCKAELPLPEPGISLEYYWCPADSVQRRAREDRVPYDLWVERGLIEATQGNVVDYRVIRRRINELRDRHDWTFREVPFDPWGATQLATDLQDDGFSMVKFPQTIAFFSPAMKEFERLIAGRRFAHAGNPVTTWMMSNVAPRSDAQGNIRPDRARSREKIDGPVALIMAVGRAMVQPASRSDSRVVEI